MIFSPQEYFNITTTRHRKNVIRINIFKRKYE